MTNKVVQETIHILNRDFCIECDEESVPILHKATGYLNQQITKMQYDERNQRETENTIILSALNAIREVLADTSRQPRRRKTTKKPSNQPAQTITNDQSDSAQNTQTTIERLNKKIAIALHDK